MFGMEKRVRKVWTKKWYKRCFEWNDWGEK